MKNFKLLTILLVFTITSCTTWQEVTLSGIEKTKITKMDDKGIEAEVEVKINNPNKIAFKVYKSDLDVTLNGNPIGKAGLKEKVKIKPNSNEVYTFHIVSKFADLGKSGGIFGLLGIALSKNVTVEIKGNIKAGKFYYKKKFPIDTKQKVPLFND